MSLSPIAVRNATGPEIPRGNPSEGSADQWLHNPEVDAENWTAAMVPVNPQAKYPHVQETTPASLAYPFFGSRQMPLWRRGAQGHRVNRKRVRRLMRVRGLAAMASTRLHGCSDTRESKSPPTTTLTINGA